MSGSGDVPTRSIPEDCPYALRRIRVSELGGQETLRFEAILCYGGVDIAITSNDGTGGCHFVRPYGGADYAALRAFELYAERWGTAQIPPVAFEPGDALIDELLWQALIIYF
ncbi:hypothetical protein [Cellulomonas persica]|uniref:hypothetical protein n=1 Tax=Cellulomonas persica TaxID=76861 RepID=UPI0011BEF4D3|nr:hypothetical protein [Cellulomonas persica]